MVCGDCNAYINYACDGINDEDIKALGNKDYTCKKHKGINGKKMENVTEKKDKTKTNIGESSHKLGHNKSPGDDVSVNK